MVVIAAYTWLICHLVRRWPACTGTQVRSLLPALFLECWCCLCCHSCQFAQRLVRSVTDQRRMHSVFVLLHDASAVTVTIYSLLFVHAVRKDSIVMLCKFGNFSQYENSTAMFCYTSLLASTHARPSIAIKYSISINISALGHHHNAPKSIDPDDGPRLKY